MALDSALRHDVPVFRRRHRARLDGRPGFNREDSLTSERTIDRKSAEEKEVVRDQLKPEDRNSLLQFEKEKADRLASSARLLYDMAKVSLGALLTCLAQMINAAVVAQRRSAPE